MGNGINHLRQQRPLVSPARFRASVARTVTPPATLSGHRYVRHHSFGLPKNTPRSSTRALFQQQPSSQLNTSFLGNSSFTGNSQGELFGCLVNNVNQVLYSLTIRGSSPLAGSQGLGSCKDLLFLESPLILLGKTSKFITAGCSQNAAAFKSNV